MLVKMPPFSLLMLTSVIIIQCVFNINEDTLVPRFQSSNNSILIKALSIIDGWGGWDSLPLINRVL